MILMAVNAAIENQAKFLITSLIISDPHPEPADGAGSE
jgi:hypothetical protein